MFEVVSLCFAFFFGLAVRQIGLPPLVGFLAAGFAINAAAPRIGLPSEAGPILEQLSHLGVLLLLFSVGLKLRLGQLAQPQVFGGALIHSAVSTAVASLGFVTFLALDWPTALLLGVVLSFSSTVFSASSGVLFFSERCARKTCAGRFFMRTSAQAASALARWPRFDRMRRLSAHG